VHFGDEFSEYETNHADGEAQTGGPATIRPPPSMQAWRSALPSTDQRSRQTSHLQHLNEGMAQRGLSGLDTAQSERLDLGRWWRSPGEVRGLTGWPFKRCRGRSPDLVSISWLDLQSLR
jgi:hypothetical protein